MRCVAEEYRRLHPDLLMQKFIMTDISEIEVGRPVYISSLKRQYFSSGLNIILPIAYYCTILPDLDPNNLVYGQLSFPVEYLNEAKKNCPGFVTHLRELPSGDPLVKFEPDTDEQ